MINKSSLIILVGGLVIVLGLSGYILYSKTITISKSKAAQTTNSESGEQPDEQSIEQPVKFDQQSNSNDFDSFEKELNDTDLNNIDTEIN